MNGRRYRLSPLSLCLLSSALLLFVGCKKDPATPPSTPPASGTGDKTPTPTPPPVAPAGSYTSMDSVPNAGKIAGTITYTGKEKDKEVTITKDKKTCCSACKAGKRGAGTLVVKDGKLKNAVVYIDGITKGKKYEPAPVTVDNKGCAFVPHVAIGYKRNKLIAKNSDPVLHNTHLFLKKGGTEKDLANIALPNEGQTIAKKIKKSGVISIKCDAHEWMQGYVFSVTHPYAVVTGDDGSFSLDDVPPGKYSVKIWHERLGEKEQSVTVAANGTAKVDVAYQ